jgi:hypothetical protein
MKNKIITRFSIFIAAMALLIFSAAPAFAVTNSTSVVSPYWQSDGDAYTFVSVSHGSLDLMSSQIGVIMQAVSNDGTTSFGTSSFTVSQNSTTRIFVVATNHSTINSSTITDSAGVFVSGTTTSSSGSLVFTPRSTTPRSDTAQITDVTSLNYWGAIVVSSASSGFAMEFIGDTHDSVFSVLTSSQLSRLPVGLN